jgi:hypothetical protein
MSDYTSGQPYSPQPPSSDGGEPTRRRGRGRKIAFIVVAVLAVIGVTGGVVVFLDHQAAVAQAERQARAERRAEARERREERQQAAALRREAQATFDACVDETSALSDALATLDARLDVGLDIDEYSDLVGDASVAYNQMDVDAMGAACIGSVGVPLENAINKYIGVASTWDDCVWDDYCSMDDIEPDMQSKWASASRLIDRASDGVDDIDPGSRDF